MRLVRFNSMTFLICILITASFLTTGIVKVIPCPDCRNDRTGKAYLSGSSTIFNSAENDSIVILDSITDIATQTNHTQSLAGSRRVFSGDPESLKTAEYYCAISCSAKESLILHKKGNLRILLMPCSFSSGRRAREPGGSG